MRQRQDQFADAEGKVFYFLSCDASFQRGHDYLMSLEDSIKMSDCTKLYDESFDVSSFNHARLLESTTLPTALIGAGNASVTGKYEAFIESLKVDIGLANLRLYSLQVLSFVADFGTESKFLDVTRRHDIQVDIEGPGAGVYVVVW